MYSVYLRLILEFSSVLPVPAFAGPVFEYSVEKGRVPGTLMAYGTAQLFLEPGLDPKPLPKDRLERGEYIASGDFRYQTLTIGQLEALIPLEIRGYSFGVVDRVTSKSTSTVKYFSWRPGEAIKCLILGPGDSWTVKVGSEIFKIPSYNLAHVAIRRNPVVKMWVEVLRDDSSRRGWAIYDDYKISYIREW